ncbi:MAG: uroporphyrinogen-III synthase [Sphingomonadales bacterium]|nr:uroporphyrinogen-III synthase [Sphingomonadales bacterium]
MSRPIIAIRPEPGCSATVARGAQMGLEIHGFPLFEIRPVAWQAPPPGEVDAVLAGSANAFRHGGAQLAALVGKPVHAVGQATARAAEQAGFAVASVGSGGLQAVLDDLAGQGLRLLRLAGRDHVALDVPAGTTVKNVIVYESVHRALPDGLVKLLSQHPVILLHSGVAAEYFSSRCNDLSLDIRNISIAALAPRIGEAAGEGWQTVRSLAQPDESELLALARDICNDCAS